MKSLKKNDIIKIEITDMTSQGNGIGHFDALAVFVPMSAIGDVLKVKIIKLAKKYAYAKIEEILHASDDRITHDCEYFPKCGGCCYRHISYESELKIKQKRVKDSIERIGGFKDVDVDSIVPAQERNHYRNKALIPIGKDNKGRTIMGFYAVNSHRIIDCRQCLLQPDEFNSIMSIVREWIDSSGNSVYNEETHKGKIRRLYIRKAEINDEIMVCLVINGETLAKLDELVSTLIVAHPNIKSIILNINKDKTNVALGKENITVYGNDFISDMLCGLRFNISPLSFFQVNRTQTEKLYAKAMEFAKLTGNETLLDLYCGTGTIGLSMAHKAKKVIGIEIAESSVINARENAKQNGIDSAEFFCADASDAAKIFKKRSFSPDVIIIDPPRKGCSPDLIETISGFSPKRVVYISCDPATLARDLKLFKEKGFLPEKITPVDMFPCTSHVETVVLLSHKKLRYEKI